MKRRLLIPDSHCQSIDRRGAAIVDMVVVIGIIAILTAIVVPMMLTARDRAERARCMTHLREIGWAMQRYADENGGRLPMVRWQRGQQVRPDVTNAGADSPDPFSLAGPPENNVPAVLFLLLRQQGVEPKTMLCPAKPGTADNSDGIPLSSRSNFSDLEGNVGYAVQNPYADDEALRAGFRWSIKSLADNFVLAADRGPAPNFCDPAVWPGAPREDMWAANSRNHAGIGQNVLYANLSVEFVQTPFAGVSHDHIYRTKHGDVLASPAGKADSILLPTEDW